MPRTAQAYISTVTDPWINLAFEEWLFRRPSHAASPHTVYLWRNNPCVVIGRNQNPFKECNLPWLRANRVPVIRRRSGGGTVVHALGNTNYTCFMPRESFNRDFSANIVARALHQLDIPAHVNTRHDIVVDNRKVSGSAFKVVHEKAYAHGTMLISSDLESLGTQLKSPRKGALVGKGVESFPSKVTRLIDHSYTVTHTDFCRAVAEEFGIVYNKEAGLKNHMTELGMADFNSNPKMQEYYDEIKTFEWKWGQTPTFTHAIEKEFIWGHLKSIVTISEGVIVEVASEVTPSSKAALPFDGKCLPDAISTFLVGTRYDDGAVGTWDMLNDFNRWEMGIQNAGDVYEWLQSAIWSGIDSVDSQP
ncbi:hypothetical protein CcCBS67573_g08104 [Chytriomyces confervae]|uniref:Putative lipoate-protein ligase A n=1 Tax=Chytriomyces confervae TaxID=246404 RepID=A0A507EQG4_9FUNG|nr:hypothetical protein CcCBS67573_g08104 [Chytriomyces confervae]